MPPFDQCWSLSFGRNQTLAVFTGRSYSLRTQRTRDSFISFGNMEKRFFFFNITPTTFFPQRYITEEPKSSLRISKAPSLPTYRSARGNCFLENTVGELLFRSTRIQYAIIGYPSEKKGVDETSEISIRMRVDDSPPSDSLKGKYDVNTLTYHSQTEFI